MTVKAFKACLLDEFVTDVTRHIDSLSHYARLMYAARRRRPGHDYLVALDGLTVSARNCRDVVCRLPIFGIGFASPPCKSTQKMIEEALKMGDAPGPRLVAAALAFGRAHRGGRCRG